MKDVRQKQKKALEESFEWLIRFNRGNLSNKEESDFFAWLEESPSHQLAYLEAEALWKNSDVLNHIQRKPKILQWSSFLDLLSIFYTTYIKINFTHKSSKPFMLSTSFLFICVISLIFSIPYLNSNNKYEAYTTNNLEFLEVLTSDGSTIYLNKNTTLELSIDDKKRNIRILSGEAYFKVAKNRNVPFMVETNTGVIRVLGTEFSVLENDDNTYITVVEGKVRFKKDLPTSYNKISSTKTKTVSALNEPKSGNTHNVLTANQQLFVTSEEHPATVQKIDARRHTQWIKNHVQYKNTRLSVILEDISRQHQVDFEFKDTTNHDALVSAALRIRDLGSCLDSLSLLLDLKYRKEDNLVIFYK